jgi:magnesium transporter
MITSRAPSPQEVAVNDPDVGIDRLYEREVISFSPESDADEVAQAFERYELVSAPWSTPRARLWDA